MKLRVRWVITCRARARCFAHIVAFEPSHQTREESITILTLQMKKPKLREGVLDCQACALQGLKQTVPDCAGGRVVLSGPHEVADCTGQPVVWEEI